MPANQPITIYIVDDDTSVCRALSRLMQSFGFNAVCFDSVDRLLELSSFSSRTCVIADICMPDTSGLALPGLLAARNHHLPIIFVTAHYSDDARAKAKQAGAAGFFRKPLDGEALVDAIHWALREQTPGGRQTNREPTRAV